MALSTGKKVLVGSLISLVGVGVAISQCRPCRQRMQKLMMTKMRSKMPHMMKKFVTGLAEDDQLEMVTHCKSMFTEMEDELNKESP